MSQVLNGCSVIQGDGVSYEVIKKILDATLTEGYSAQNVAFGMGGGLLQVSLSDFLKTIIRRKLTAIR